MILQVNLSTRPEKSVGSNDIWHTAESALQTALETKVLRMPLILHWQALQSSSGP